MQRPLSITLNTFLEDHKDNSTKGIVFISSATEEFLSYKELFHASLNLLHELQQRGVKPGSELIIQVEDNKQFLLLFWACLLGGIVAVPLSAATQQEYRRKVVTIATTLSDAFIVADDACINRLTEYVDRNELRAEQEDVLRRCMRFNDLVNNSIRGSIAERSTEDIAYIQYSSGSTGDSKGVVLTHGNLVSNALDIAERSLITESDTLLSWMPLTHDMGLICFHLTSLVSGTNQCVLPTSLFIRRPLLWIEKANQHKASVLYSPNFGYHYFLSAYKPEFDYNWDLSSLRLIYNGAEQVSASLCNDFVTALHKYKLDARCMFPGYGLAEASVAVTLPEPGKGFTLYNLERSALNVGDTIRMDATGKGVSFVTVGKPVASCLVRICDNNHRPLPDSVVGHIQIKGLNVTRGYYKNEKATQAVFTGDGWLQTGDLGFMREGLLVITGRLKNIIIINGQNYYPSDIEWTVQELTGIGKVAVCGVGNEEAQPDQLVIFILHKGSIKEFAWLAAKVKRQLFSALGLVAHAIVPVNKLPKTTSGKIQHFQLAGLYKQGAFTDLLLQLQELERQGLHNDAASTLSAADWLCLLFENRAGIEHIGCDDDFFELGINSLQALQLLGDINERFSTELTIKDFFDNPSIARLSKVINIPVQQENIVIARDAVTGDAKASSIQHRFWKIEQLQEELAPLNISLIYTINGKVNSAALEAAVAAVVQRHDSLRTVFYEQDDVLLQRVVKPEQLPVCLETVVLEEGVPADQLLQRYVHKRFNLADGPLYRFMLLETAQQEFVFAVVLHHLIADGWSLSVLVNELNVAYAATIKEESIKLPVLQWQFADCINRRQQLVTDIAMEKSRLYWSSVLDECPPRVNNLSAKQSTVIASYKGKKQQLLFTAEQVLAIKQCSAGNQVTLFTTLMAIVLVLLHRVSNEKDIVLGTDSAGRDGKVFENQVGCFIQTLLLRIVIHEEDDFRSVLKQVKSRLLDGMQQQAYTYEQLLQSGSYGRQAFTGLFNVLVLFHHFDTQLTLGDAQVKQTDVDSGTSLCDLQLEFVERNHTLSLQAIYNTDVFTDEEVSRLLSFIPPIIAEVTASSTVPVSKLDILTEAETKKILTEFNSAPVAYAPGETVISLFEKQVQLTPGNSALVFAGSSWTYQQVNDSANQLARYLILQYNAQEGDCIALLADRSAGAIIAMLAILKTGAAYVPIDVAFPENRVELILNSCNARLIIAEPEACTFSTQRSIELLDDNLFTGKLASFACTDLQRYIRETDTAYLIYTSGTEGIPKGVLIAHSSLYDYVQTFKNYFQLAAADAVVQQASLSFDTAAEEIFPILTTGGKLVVHRGGGRDIEGLLQVMESNAVTVLSTTPLVLNEINKQAARVNYLRVVISGGDRLKFAHIDQLLRSVPVYNTYGPTETTVCAAYYNVTTTETSIPIGKPIANRQIYILNDAGALQAVGFVGEICISGAGLAQGYMGDAALTARKFCPHPFRQGERLYRTGDLGRWLPDGNIEFAGRKDSQVKINGYRVELKELEQVLLQHPDVSDVLIEPVQDESGQPALAAYCTSAFQLAGTGLRAFMRTHLPDFMIPAFFISLHEFPYTLNGKIDRRALPKPVTHSGDDGQKPGTVLEMQLLAIWQSVFGAAAITVTDGFYDIGGNSITAFQVASRIQKELGIQAELKHLMAGLSIREMALLLAAQVSGSYNPIEKAPASEWYNTSHAQKRLWILNEIDAHAHSNNLNWSYVLQGDVNIAALENAFGVLVERHESLRTTYSMLEGKLMQRINPCTESPVQYKDIRLQENPLQLAIAINAEEAATALSPETGPLLKVVLLHIADSRFILIVTMHHIATDGLSVNTMVKELQELYTAGITGKPQQLIPLSIQYKDYAQWEALALKSERSEKYKQFWQNTYSDKLSGAGIPADYERKVTREYNNEYMQLPLGSELSASLIEFCRSEQVSQAVLLMAAVNCLLYKYTGTKEMVTGVLLNGRAYPELEDQVGFFINTLPLYVSIKQDDTFSALLQQVKAAELELFEYQYYPYDLLCEAVAGGKGMFTLLVSSDIEGGNEIYQLPGIQVSEFQPRSKWRNDLDVTLAFEQVAGPVALGILFDTGLYRQATIEKAAHGILSIISTVLTHPQIPVQEIQISAQEKSREAYWKQFSTGELENMLSPFLTQGNS